MGGALAKVSFRRGLVLASGVFDETVSVIVEKTTSSRWYVVAKGIMYVLYTKSEQSIAIVQAFTSREDDFRPHSDTRTGRRVQLFVFQRLSDSLPARIFSRILRMTTGDGCIMASPWIRSSSVVSRRLLLLQSRDGC